MITILGHLGFEVIETPGQELRAVLGGGALGFAIGARPRAGGGIGVLYDRSGNDFYNAEIYAQGTSYWYSLGMLIDERGQDIYNATQYAQGAGVHLSIGYLCDGAGDDSYHSRFGPGQGGAHGGMPLRLGY